MLVDTHCHLDASYFPDGADAAIERARSLGVDAFVCIGVGSLAAARNALELAERRPDVVATVGVHPHDAASFDAELEGGLRPLFASDQLVAIGEVGLDYHYDHSPREVQQAVFRGFVQIARELGKPLVIHTRSAPADTLQILDDENARDVGGVIHCFSEDRDFARQAFDLGFDVSFSGIVTFKNSTAIQDVAAWAPADRILVETDSPYLAPVPMRGKPCEPAFVVHTARRVAELRGLSLEDLAEISTQNAIRRFGPALDRAVRAMQTKRDGH